MNHLWPTACLVAMCGAASAQSFVVSPHFIYTRSEGPGACTGFGLFAAGRYQFADGIFRNIAGAIKGLSYRFDHRDYQVDSGMGRTWTSVSIKMSDGDLNTFGTTFSQNVSGTATEVFKGSVTWPVQLGVPATLPAAWAVQLPFTTSWNYSGKKDILADLQFAGGTLANAAPWSGRTAVPYYLDSFSVGSFANGEGVSLGNINGGCVDSRASRVVGASVRVTTASYAMTHPTANLRNKYSVEAKGTDLGPSTAAFLIFTFNADTNGLPLQGVSCNRVHLDVRRFLFFHAIVTDPFGGARYDFGVPGGLAPYISAFAGTNLVAQGAWADTVNGSLKLSAAGRNSLVAVPPFASTATVPVKVAYDPDPRRAKASFGATGSPAAIPLIRYTY